MTSVYVPPSVQPRIQPDKFIQSNLVVSPNTTSLLVTHANQVLYHRRKELFSAPGLVGGTGTIPASVATRERWRFAGHTGTHLDYLSFEILAARPSTSGSAAARLDLYDATGTTLLATLDISYGGRSTNDTPNELVELSDVVAIPAGIEFTAVISDIGKGRLAHACVYEVGLQPSTENGYLPSNIGTTSPILDEDRSDPAELMTTAWKENASSCIHYPTDGFTTTSATDKNIIDGTSTTVTTATPGFTVDMRYKNRRSKTTVPVRLRVYATCTTPGGGHLRLKDSGGTTVLEVAGFGTGGWHTIDGTLPDTQAKYDLLAGVAGGATLVIHAVSLYELDAVAAGDTIDTTIPIGDITISAAGKVEVKGTLGESIGTVGITAAGTAAQFDVTFSAPGSAAHGGSFGAYAQYTATPTGQTSASVRIQVGGVFEEDSTLIGIVDTEPEWLDSFPTADGWTLSTDWTSNGSHGYYCILTNTSIGTSGIIASFNVHVRNDSHAVGATITIENDYSGQSVTAAATSPDHFNNITVT